MTHSLRIPQKTKRKLKNKQLIFIALVALLCGCTIRPNGVLSKRKLQNVLYDLHKTEGALQEIGYTYAHDYESSVYFQSVLNKHGVTQAQFDSSLVWYTDHPLLFNRVYPQVLDRLKAEQEKYQQLSAEAIDMREKAREAKRTNNWEKWMEQHTKPMQFYLWKDTFSTDFTPPLMEKVTFSEKNDEKTCINEKKVVPLQPISKNGDAMLLRKHD